MRSLKKQEGDESEDFDELEDNTMTQMEFKFCNAALTKLIGYDVSKADFRKRTSLKN